MSKSAKFYIHTYTATHEFDTYCTKQKLVNKSVDAPVTLAQARIKLAALYNALIANNHSVYHNHACTAIVDSTTKLIHKITCRK